MNKQQKAVQKAALTAEEAELKALKAIYRKASEEVAEKIAIHQGTINTLLRNYDKLSEAEKSILQSKIYQKQFQESLQKQLDGFLNDLDGKQFESISAYLEECYQNGYIGTVYDLAGQGIPITTPIDQQDVVKATNIDSKISTDLYTKLGEDVDLLKARIKASISVGIATASTYSQMATKIASDSNVGFNRAMRIARTEGHRVQIAAAMDAQHKAKSKGADVLKKWSSALDARTRPTHKILDGQIRELDEHFEVNGKQALAPGHFGIAGEDINCRCALVQTARWALDEEYLEEMQKRAEYFGLDKSDEFEDFKKKYLGIPSANGSNKSARNGKTIQFDWKGTDARHANQQQIIKSLSDEYNTRLQKVTIGARQAAGDVDITGSRMRLSDAKTHTAIHEFAHTLANSTADKLGLTNDSGFWKEIRSIRNAYHRDVDKMQNVSRWISHYEHSNKSVDEFLAEAFTQAKMHELGLELPETYGSDLTYSKKVLEVVDKYFKKEPLENIGKSSKIKLSINLFDKNDPLYLDAFSVEEEKGFEDICLHGSQSSVQKKINGKLKNMTASEFAEYLKEETDYSGGDIRLASCETGKGDNSFAQQLSKELGIKVKAPDSDVYYAPDEGTLFVGSPHTNTGKWRTFNNGVEE